MRERSASNSAMSSVNVSLPTAARFFPLDHTRGPLQSAFKNQLYRVNEHLGDLDFVSIQVRSSGYPTGQPGSVRNRPPADATIRKYVNKRWSTMCSVTLYEPANLRPLAAAARRRHTRTHCKGRERGEQVSLDQFLFPVSNSCEMS